MAMSEGTITINSSSGAIETASGCAGEVFTAMDSAQDYGGVTGAALASAREQLANLARAVAKVVPHIQNNAVVPAGIALDIPGEQTSGTGTVT